MDERSIKDLVAKIIAKSTAYTRTMYHPLSLPVGISNRHVHLSSMDLEVLFGKGYELKKHRRLSQTGQFAAIETVMVAGKGGCLENVRVLGPVRKQTQVEISATDAHKLKFSVPIRESGDLEGTPGITLIGPVGCLVLREGLIIAKRHIHMTPDDAVNFNVRDGQNVQVKTAGNRSLVFDDVVVRVNRDYVLEYHIDTDEANAAGLKPGITVKLLVSNVDKGVVECIESDSRIVNGPQSEKHSLITEEAVHHAYRNKLDLMISKSSIITPLAKDAVKELKVNMIIE